MQDLDRGACTFANANHVSMMVTASDYARNNACNDQKRPPFKYNRGRHCCRRRRLYWHSKVGGGYRTCKPYRTCQHQSQNCAHHGSTPVLPNATISGQKHTAQAGVNEFPWKTLNYNLVWYFRNNAPDRAKFARAVTVLARFVDRGTRSDLRSSFLIRRAQGARAAATGPYSPRLVLGI